MTPHLTPYVELGASQGNPNSLKREEKTSGSRTHKANGHRVSAEEAEGN